MSDSIVVAAAVVVRGGRFLVGRRPTHKRHGDLWEFPGGKLLPGESVADALTRELREELDLDVEWVGPVLGEVNDPGSPFVIVFVETEAVGTPRPAEHSELAWLDPEGLRAAALAPADRRFVETRFGHEGVG